ncbi:hypothetical protein [Sporisorium scitamineum]|uniref:Uncharacterized protein n=1 Tax=Sporisorium scitamineum TaxID=49012 RepID=A0A0F7SD59_9BASI|nr:hypothetical protein [Sporisorium scitamineum]
MRNWKPSFTASLLDEKQFRALQPFVSSATSPQCNRNASISATRHAGDPG